MALSLPRALSPLLAALLLFLPSACSSGSSGGGPAQVDLLLGDAPVDELLSFELTVDSLRLQDPGGTFTPNLLAAPVRLEFLGLQETFAWVASAAPPKGTYSAVEVRFETTSVEARAQDGSSVTVTVLSDTLSASLPAGSQLDSGYARFLVDLDLRESLSGDVGLGAITFDPSGSATLRDGGEDARIDEIEGVVQSLDRSARRLVLDAYADGNPALSLGDVVVQLSDATLLLDDQDQLIPDEQTFLDGLVLGTTLLEVHGDLTSAGRIDATRIEVEDAIGGGNTVARIEGLVLAVDPGTSFELLIREIEKGQSLVQSVLGGLGNPASITVAYDAATVFFTDSGSLTGPEVLAAGQELKVKFAEFTAEPFLATAVELEDVEPELQATSVDVAGLPSTIVVHVDDDEPALLSGDVASSTTDVVVTIASAALVLDVDEEIDLAPADLLTGLDLRLRGALSGPPTAPTLAATRVEVRPGELDEATVTASDPASSTFTTSGGELDEPFGGPTTAGPFTVEIEPGCAFTGDATSEAAFHALVAGLGAGDTLLVEVEGLGTDLPGTIRAFAVEVELERDDDEEED